ncbi:DUF6221 family protein [Georgenia thermotolerans]|uniref:Uncharacterized protein n=1 Tax=Georgenia thermotolerans TaxID=527326 RepID=A0A7J5UMQ8_9MICO|nr:DUF6221 family protein [Georgenia thermotolerans]KAE8763637.1 hypothetical protein GB883_13015 [Georgenia thermotolerans]
MGITEFLLARLAEEEAAAGRDGGDDDARRPRGWHDPARVRAECAAVRTVLGLHQRADDIWGFDGCLVCGNVADTTHGYPCPTVRVLAAVWDGHPDYRAEWAPGRGGHHVV